MRNCPIRVSATLVLIACALGAHATGKGKEDCRVITRTESKAIPYDVRYEFSRLVSPGRIVKAQDGEEGEVRKIYRLYFQDGKQVGSELYKTEIDKPVPAVYHMAREGFETSRGSFGRSKIVTMEASAYDPSPATIGPKATGRTKTGRWAGYGCVAVDPKFIKLGTMLYVEGYGLALACDIGSAIKGNRIDLCYETRAEAIRFGRRQVRVHILNSR